MIPAGDAVSIAWWAMALSTIGSIGSGWGGMLRAQAGRKSRPSTSRSSPSAGDSRKRWTSAAGGRDGPEDRETEEEIYRDQDDPRMTLSAEVLAALLERAGFTAVRWSGS